MINLKLGRLKRQEWNSGKLLAVWIFSKSLHKNTEVDRNSFMKLASAVSLRVSPFGILVWSTRVRLQEKQNSSFNFKWVLGVHVGGARALPG